MVGVQHLIRRAPSSIPGAGSAITCRKLAIARVPLVLESQNLEGVNDEAFG
jgi:hypothetical protein